VPMYTFVGIIGLSTGVWNFRKLEKIWKKWGGIAWK
jgi:hypothetical protein